MKGGGRSKKCAPAAQLLEGLYNENKSNFEDKTQALYVILYGADWLLNKFIEVLKAFGNICKVLFMGIMPLLGVIIKAAGPTMQVVAVVLGSLIIIFGVILLCVFLFLWAWYGDSKKASNEFKKLFGDDKKDKNLDTSLSADSYMSKFNLKNIFTNFFIFFDIDNILSDDQLSCRKPLENEGQCNDTTHISGKYLSSKSPLKCYNLKTPNKDIKWKLDQYTKHHYTKLNNEGLATKQYDKVTGYTKGTFEEEYDKKEIKIKWIVPENDYKYYKLDCETFYYNDDSFKSGLICQDK